jgi:hypothetical protein
VDSWLEYSADDPDCQEDKENYIFHQLGIMLDGHEAMAGKDQEGKKRDEKEQGKIRKG